MRLSIRWKLTLLICGPLIAINAALLLWDYQRQKNAAIEQMVDLISEKARTSADQFNARLETLVQAAEATAANLTSHGVPADAQLQTIAAGMLRQNIQAIGAVVAFDSPNARHDGAFIRRAPGGTRRFPITDVLPAGRPDPEWYTTPRQTLRPAWSSAFTGVRQLRGTMHAYAVPFFDGKQFRGVVATFLRAEQLQAVLTRAGTFAPAVAVRRANPGRRGRGRNLNPASSDPPASEPIAATQPAATSDSRSTSAWSLAAPFGPDGFFILDRNRRIISHPDENRLDKPWPTGLESSHDPGSVSDAWAEMLAQSYGAVPIQHLEDVDPAVRPDTAHWIAFAHIPSTGWIFATAIPQSLVIAPIVTQLQHRAVFLLAGVLIVALIITWVSMRISHPIVGLASAVQRLADGDLQARVEGIRSRDELGTLAEGFNSMVAQLQEKVAALARETAAREGIEMELRIARQIQQDLLPSPLQTFAGRADFDLYAMNVPARRVGGDFYDFFFVGDKVVLVIADVSGKGMPAALLMAVTRTVVRNFASLDLTPAQIVIHTNQTLVDNSVQSMFVTMFLAHYEPASGRLRYVCAGHPPPLILSPDNSTPLGPPTGPLLGIFDGSQELAEFHQAERTLQPGETLFLYTDGVTDARAPDGHILGDDGLIRAFASINNSNARSLCERLIAGLHAFEHGGQSDDITVLALRRIA